MTEPIEQRYEQDCFLCCICMAAGISYDKAQRDWGEDFVLRVGQNGLFGADITYAYNAVGLAPADYRLIFTEFREHGPLVGNDRNREMLRSLLWGRRAIIQVPSKNYEGRQHVVYWDGHELFDPSPLQTYTWNEIKPVYIWIFNDRPRVLNIYDIVILKEIPPGFLDGLPEDEQEEIKAIVGKPLLLSDFSYGEAEIEFTDSKGSGYHKIWVNTDYLKRV